MSIPEKTVPEDQSKFGTFGGVFVPSTLTILGVILFLRFGQVVGQSGFLYAVVIVLLAKLITTLTAVSLAATATNTRIKGGGAYYLISRSLGNRVWGRNRARLLSGAGDLGLDVCDRVYGGFPGDVPERDALDARFCFAD